MPITFLAYHLTETEYETLLSHHIWSSEAITFRIVPIDPPCPDYLFTIRGLATIDEKRIFDMVNQIWNDADTITYIAGVVNKSPNGSRDQVQETLTHLIRSLKITLLRIWDKSRALKLHFNIYIDGNSTKDEELWVNLCTFLANRKYSLCLQGTRTVVKAPFYCSVCYGIDHPRGICPFPKVRGWNGPLNRAEDDPRNRGRYYGRLA